MSKKILLSIFICLLLVMFFLVKNYPRSVKSEAVPATPQSTTSSQVKGASNLYPDHALTPGDVFADVTAQQVCVSGYSSSVRNVPLVEKKQVYSEYLVQYPQPQGAYEVDHFISLELGGSNDIKNLWLEPAEPRPGFHEKDVVENYLHQQVCSGAESLQQAQAEISTDWYAAYLKIRK